MDKSLDSFFRSLLFIQAGFYARKSCYTINNSYRDFNENSNILEIPVRDLSKRETVNISYQMKVSTGLEGGTYSSVAICTNNTTGEVMSNESVLSLPVIPDTVFTPPIIHCSRSIVCIP